MSQEQKNKADDADYILPEPDKEVQRLTANDSVFLHAMKGKRILAPIDLSKPGLKILDSATADGSRLSPLSLALYPITRHVELTNSWQASSSAPSRLC